MSVHISGVRAGECYSIPGGLNQGRKIGIRGRVDSNVDRFHVNLQTTRDNSGDVVFHFNPRQKEDVVVRNSRVGGSWQSEERDQPYFPFHEGKYFWLMIEVTDTGYDVYVNGKRFISYGFRDINPETARYIFLSEGAEYYDMRIQGMPRTCVPYVAEIPDGMQPGKAIRVRGACTDSDGFSVNFTQDPQGDFNCFHFNPRPREGVVVRNSKIDGGWGPEERGQDNFPFGAGEYFDTVIVARENDYIVYVNDEIYTTYSHRCDVGYATFLIVRGSVDLADVQYYEPVADDFVKIIPSGLEKGDVLSVHGYFKPDGERFAINLLEGRDTNDNIAFHFNPRRGEGQVVMNSKFNGSWQNEERVELPHVFTTNKPFEIKIVTKRRKFKVFVNDRKLCQFMARGNVEAIHAVQVKGQAYFEQVELHRKPEFRFNEIPGNLRPGMWIVVKGIPKKDRGRFAVNLRTGGDDESDIAFHFNPRLNENCVVRNTRQGGSWGPEEREQPDFPFEKKDNFELAICVQDDKFVTYVNGSRFITYNHRVPVSDISHINLQGAATFLECEIY